MFKQKASTISTPLAIIAVVILLGVTAYVICVLSGADKSLENPATGFTSNQITGDDSADTQKEGWTTYTNDDYNFSFQYPDTWEAEDFDHPISQDEIEFAVGFTDPERKEEMDVGMCVNNEAVGWLNPTPTQSECQSKLANLSEEEKSGYSALMLERNIYLYVYKNVSEMDLKDWLTNHYRQPQTELHDYSPTDRVIEMGGVSGLVSDIGCCAGYNMNHVIQKDSLVYELGTSYSDGDTTDTPGNTLLNEIAETFKFTDSE